MEEEKIMYDSSDSASIQTLTGWVCSNGLYWGKDEGAARWSGCTHKICECGGEMNKSYTKCSTCRKKASTERYNSLEYQKYNHEPVFSNTYDLYFFDKESILDFAHHNDIEDLNELELIICEPETINEIDTDYLWEDIMPDDMQIEDVSPKLAEKLNELNKFIKESNITASWYQGKYRTSVK